MTCSNGISIQDLPDPGEVLIRILAYACDPHMYSDEKGLDEEYGPHINNLLETCSEWRLLIAQNETRFQAWRRRARYLSK